jgi:hypothetical protein
MRNFWIAMNKQCCLIIMFLTCEVCIGQNMVNNWSFEDTISCPTNLSQIDRAVGWTSFRCTPDYFNACASATPITGVHLSVPHNVWGDQNAHTGNAYGAFIAYTPNTSQFNEFIATQLNQPMIIGQKYFVSFWVSTAFGYANSQYPGLACNNIGAKFSSVAYSQANPQTVDNFAHIVNTNIINDTINWIKVSGSFIADSAYQYISIGNFYDNVNTTIDSVGVNSNTAIYYLDDVKLSTDSAFVNGINEQSISQIEVYPNPFTDKMNITVKRNVLVEVNLYDVTSRKIFHQSFTNTTSINTEQLAKGIYLYEVRDKNRIITKGTVVKN